MEKTILSSFALLLAASALTLAGTTRLVPSEYATIQAAIDDCVNGDEVVVEPNTYTGPGNRDIDFLGKAITVRSTDPNDPDIVAATVIDCNGVLSDKHRGFYFHSGEDYNSVLSGLTIKNGYAFVGGGIFCDGASPTITNCTITRNEAGYGGGLSLYNGSSLMITKCTISGNTAGKGGGIECSFGSTATIRNCTITGNRAHDDWYEGIGGGIICNLQPAGGTRTQTTGSMMPTRAGVLMREIPVVRWPMSRMSQTTFVSIWVFMAAQLKPVKPLQTGLYWPT